MINNVMDLIRRTVGATTPNEVIAYMAALRVGGVEKAAQLSSARRLLVAARDGQGYQQIPLC